LSNFSKSAKFFKNWVLKDKNYATGRRRRRRRRRFVVPRPGTYDLVALGKKNQKKKKKEIGGS
jgi:hypothetical protein